VRKKLKKITYLLIFIIFSTQLVGCFNYRDINKIVFITAMIIDIDEQDNIMLYTEAFKPTRETTKESGKGQRILYKGKGKTLFEAVRDNSLASSYKSNYTQNRAIIVTKKAAEKGFDKFMDFLDRDQEILLRAYMFVFDGGADELIKMNLKQEEYIGVYLYNLIQITGAASRALSITLNQYLTRRVIGSDVVVIPIIKPREERIEDIIELSGGAVIEDNKMVSNIAKKESQGYNFLINKVKTGTLEITNPDNPDKYVTLEILNSNTRTDIELNDDKIKLTKKILVRTSVAESQGNLQLNEANKKKLQKSAESNIKKYTTEMFEQYKNKNIDIFNVKEELERKYPKSNIDKPMEKTDLEVNVSVEVEGSSTKLDAK
jgi:spore germination protein KC